MLHSRPTIRSKLYFQHSTLPSSTPCSQSSEGRCISNPPSEAIIILNCLRYAPVQACTSLILYIRYHLSDGRCTFTFHHKQFLILTFYLTFQDAGCEHIEFTKMHELDVHPATSNPDSLPVQRRRCRKRG